MKKSPYEFNSPSLPPLPSIPNPVEVERLFTMTEAGQYLKVGPRTIGKLISDESRPNKLKASWVGRRWLIPESSLRAFVDAQQSSAE